MAVARPSAVRSPQLRVTVICLAGVVLLAAAFGIAMQRSSYDVWAALLVAPALVLISLPALLRQAARESDRRVGGILVLALIAKLGGAIARYFVAFGVYGGASDAGTYWKQGAAMGMDLRHGVVDFGVHAFSGTSFVRVLVALSSSITGPSLPATFLIFSWIGFWGLFMWYRAFRIAMPDGDRRTYAYLVFFLPSLVFWPSSVGKEAWVVFGLGVMAFGAARLFTGRSLNGLASVILGSVAIACVRPHIAGVAALALAVGVILAPSALRLRELAPVAKGLAIIVVAAIALMLVARTDAFLRASGIDPSRGVSGILAQTSQRTDEGGSRFEPSILSSPWRAPLSAVTVLFRPVLPEARNAQAAFAALEGTFLIALCFVRLRWIGTALRQAWRRPYLAFAIAYTALFVLAFSSIANFGILVRERVQVLPAFLVLLCLPPADRGESPRRWTL